MQHFYITNQSGTALAIIERKIKHALTYTDKVVIHNHKHGQECAGQCVTRTNEEE